MPPPTRSASASFAVIEWLTILALFVMLTVIVLPLLSPKKAAPNSAPPATAAPH